MSDLLNADFYSFESQNWYRFVLENFVPDPAKPLVFLPCANGHKTRKKYGKKKISESTTHQFLSAITRNDSFEKVIISEPLTVIPYIFEDLMPDYNYPPEFLPTLPIDCVLKDTWQLQRRLSIFLFQVSEQQSFRKKIYYIGGKHHFTFLERAIHDLPFELVYCIPAKGVRDYSRSANLFSQQILEEVSK